MTDAVIAVLVLLPLALTYFLKANAALAYLAVCGGYVIQNFSGSDILNVLGKAKLSGVSSADVTLVLLIVPMLLTLFSSVRSWRGQTGMLLQLLAALAVGVLLAIIAVPFLGSVVDVSLSSSKIWPQIQHIRGTFMIVATLYVMILVWMMKTTHPDKKKH